MDKTFKLYSFKKDIYCRYLPGPTESKLSGFFSDSESKNARYPEERIVLAFKKNKEYESFFSADGILIIYGEGQNPYPVLCRKDLLKNFLKETSLCIIEKNGEQYPFCYLSKNTKNGGMKIICTKNIFWTYSRKANKEGYLSKNRKIASPDEISELVFEEEKEYRLYFTSFSKNEFSIYAYGNDVKPYVFFISKNPLSLF